MVIIEPINDPYKLTLEEARTLCKGRHIVFGHRKDIHPCMECMFFEPNRKCVLQHQPMYWREEMKLKDISDDRCHTICNKHKGLCSNGCPLFKKETGECMKIQKEKYKDEDIVL